MQILVDTNVFLDFFLKRENYEEVKKFFTYSLRLKNQLFINALSLRDIEYVAHHVFHDKERSKQVQMLAYGLCHKVIGLTSDSTIESLYSNVDDYEDSLMIECARENLIDIIVTSNIKDYKNGNFPVFTPKELVDIWSRN